MLDWILFFIKAVTEVIGLGLICVHLFGARRRSSGLLVGAVLGYATLAATQLTFAYQLTCNAATTTCLLLAATLVYEMKWMHRLFAAMVLNAAAISSEAAVWLSIRAVTGLNGQSISRTLWYYPLTTLACAGVGLAVVCLLCRLVPWFGKRMERVYGAMLLLCCVLCFLMAFLLVSFAAPPHLPGALLVLGLILVLLLLCVYLFSDQLHTHRDRMRLEFLEKQSEAQIAHYAALYAHDRDTHKLRHDMKNFTLGARSLLRQGEYEQLDSYLTQLLGEVQPETLTDTGNPLLDAIVSAKRANVPDIPFYVMIPVLAYGDIDPMDAAMLLAAALDNAVEGCKGHPSPYIAVRIRQQTHTLTISVENPTVQPVVTQDGRLTTRKQQPEHHGYGVRGMEKIVRKYHGNLVWTCENGIFTINLFLQKDDG